VHQLTVLPVEFFLWVERSAGHPKIESQNPSSLNGARAPDYGTYRSAAGEKVNDINECTSTGHYSHNIQYGTFCVKSLITHKITV
jgi:hypothetical protein